MDTFYQVFGFVAAISIGIIALTAFFTTIGYFKRKTRSFDIVKMKGFVNDGRLVNIHMSDGQVYRNMRFIGFSDQSSAKAGFPFQLSQMVVCETQNGARVFFRPDGVRIIEEAENVG